MSEPFNEEKFVKVLVAMADENAAKVRRLHTVNPELADDFMRSHLDDSEMAWAVWTENKRYCCLLLRRAMIAPSREGIAAVWVEDRATAEALKKKLESQR
jgi:hypothetical protein